MKTYQKPTWSSKPKIQWYLEVIKNGTVLENINLPKDFEFVVIGRHKDFCTNNFVFEHESISRQHAIIQHRENGRIYLYDLGSTHHSYWNKNEIKPFVYIPLRVGDILKFGESTRMYVVQSDDPKAIQLSEEQRIIQNNALKPKKKDKEDSEEEDNLKEQDEEDEEDEEDKKAFDEEDNEELVARKRLRIEEEFNDNSLFDDQDEFFDRTLKGKKKEKVKIETFTTLTTKKNEILRKINELEIKKKETKDTISNIKFEESDDALDQYMNNVKSDLIENGTSSIDEELEKLKEKEKQLNVLIEMSKPTIEGVKTEEEKRKESKLDIIKNSMFVDRKPKNIHFIKEKKEPKLLDVNETKIEENQKQEIEDHKEESDKIPDQFKGVVQNEDFSSEKNEDLPLFVPSNEDEENDLKNNEEYKIENKEIKEKPKNKRKRKKNKEPKGPLNFYETVDEKTSEWIAPKDQKGDGTTHLNEKYGY